MQINEIRTIFIDFFKSKDHKIIQSSSVIPLNDPSLLFTNAGMNQFKNVFLGLEKYPYARVATIQKCIRAGGKHNDLSNVGYTTRHHTFFEMLGNFSFGDYSKLEAIQYAWELLTKVFNIPEEKLWITVYEKDHETYEIWLKKIKIPITRINLIGDKDKEYLSDNFWMMGESGPCGPCTEIFYDHGPEFSGDPPKDGNDTGERYIEIWNNVFIQFTREKSGAINPLPVLSIDTGMGLERISAILQGVHSNYDIDLFKTLLNATQNVMNKIGVYKYDLRDPSLKVIIDHIRSITFILADGIVPGNTGRNYVLRRIIRRAIYHGYKLGIRVPFLYQLIHAVITEMKIAYPELEEHKENITDILKQEEKIFFQTISTGINILYTALSKSTGIIDGETVFKLHDTYGFPLDLTCDICCEKDVIVDKKRFQILMDAQKEQRNSKNKFKSSQSIQYFGMSTQFLGYQSLIKENTFVLAIYKNNDTVNHILEGEESVIVLDCTPFYAEGGGQVGDKGFLKNNSSLFTVKNTFRIQDNVFGHHGKLLTGELKIGDQLCAEVNSTERKQISRNHSATHLMHKALREVLGNDVHQKGSSVNSSKLRFDFAYTNPVTFDQIKKIENLVNNEILKNKKVNTFITKLEDAKKLDAIMLFENKYIITTNAVRVLEIGFSKELCGGTHVNYTAEIGCFKIISELGVSAGIRRIEAITGEIAIEYFQDIFSKMHTLSTLFKVQPVHLNEKIIQLKDQTKILERNLERLSDRFVQSYSEILIQQMSCICGIKLLVKSLDIFDEKITKKIVQQLKNKLKTSIIVLTSVNIQANKIQLVVGVTSDLIPKIKAEDLINHIAHQIDGKGGGRPDLAMGSGNNLQNLKKALQSIDSWIRINFASKNLGKL